MIALIRNNRVLFASLVVLLIAAAAFLSYSGPIGFPAALRVAAQNRDAIRLDQLVDFAAVREGLKSDLKAQLVPASPQPAPASTDIAPAPAAPASAAIDQAVDQLVTEQGLEQVVASPPAPSAANQLLDALFPKARNGQRFRVDHRYLAFDRFRYTLANMSGKSSVDVDLQRQGLFGWRVARVTSNLDSAALRLALTPSPPQQQVQEDGQVLSSAPPAPPAQPADSLPTDVGQCADTTVKEVSTRLDGVADSGSAISFTNGGYQVSYDQVAAVDQSRAGDPINICLVSVPDDCPPGDDRGKTYKATNGRTGGSWTLPDSEHMCGGA